METQKLSIEDTDTLKKAMFVHKKTILITIFFNLVFFAGLKLAIKTTDNNHLPSWLLTLIPFIPLTVIIYIISKYRSYVVDIRKGEKFVFKGKCKLKIEIFDGLEVCHLFIDGFKTIEFSEYNYENHRKKFTKDETLDCEIHFAPESETILYFKKL